MNILCTHIPVTELAKPRGREEGRKGGREEGKERGEREEGKKEEWRREGGGSNDACHSPVSLCWG